VHTYWTCSRERTILVTDSVAAGVVATHHHQGALLEEEEASDESTTGGLVSDTLSIGEAVVVVEGDSGVAGAMVGLVVGGAQQGPLANGVRY
jgi:hypothetical protein